MSSSSSHNPPIGHLMSTSEVVARLGDHGCENMTDRLDLSSCGIYPLSNGGFGDVYRGKLLDGSPIAIKTIRIHVNTHERQKPFKNAARELHTWSKCRHPNVMQLLGLVEFRDQIGMVSHWMENGSLPSYLEKSPSVDRFQMSFKICEGLMYLHAQNIVHGDLKGLNVLISDDGAPMLTDFGNAVMQNSTLQVTATTTKVVLSPRWAAPELLKGGPHSYSADVYALGMTILETISGKVPYSEKSDFAVYAALLVTKELPLRPEESISSRSHSGNQLWLLLTSCWVQEPESRPSVGQVHETMIMIARQKLEVDAEPESDPPTLDDGASSGAQSGTGNELRVFFSTEAKQLIFPKSDVTRAIGGNHPEFGYVVHPSRDSADMAVEVYTPYYIPWSPHAIDNGPSVETEVVFILSHPETEKYDMSRMRHRKPARREEVERVLFVAARWSWYLKHTNDSWRSSATLSVEMMKLFEISGYDAVPVEGPLINLNNAGVVEFVIKDQDRYGLRLTSRASVPLHIQVFFFDTTDLSIHRMSGYGDHGPMIPAHGQFMIGDDQDGGSSLMFAISPGVPLEVGFLKVFWSTDPLQLDDLEQESAFENEVQTWLSKPRKELFGGRKETKDWGTVLLTLV